MIIQTNWKFKEQCHIFKYLPRIFKACKLQFRRQRSNPDGNLCNSDDNLCNPEGNRCNQSGWQSLHFGRKLLPSVSILFPVFRFKRKCPVCKRKTRGQGAVFRVMRQLRTKIFKRNENEPNLKNVQPRLFLMEK